MDLYYETPREMLSLDEMLEGDLKFCLDEMEPELKDLNWSAGGGLENLTSWGGVIGSTGADYWSANCLTLSGQQQQAQQDHRLPAFDLTLTPENTPANKMVNPKSVIPSRIRSMQFEFEMEMMANDDDTDDDDDDEQEYHDRTIDVDDVEGRNVSTAGAAVDRRSPSPSGNEDEEDVVMKIEPRDQVEDEGLESSFEGSNHEIEVKTEKDVEEEVDLPNSVDASRAQVQRVFPTFQKTQMVKTSVNGAPHVMKQVPVRSQPVQVQRTAQGGKPRTLWLLKKQPPVKPNLQNSPPEKDVERIIKTQTVTNPNGVQILKPNLQKLKIISSSSSDSPQQLYISRTTALSSPPAVSPKITANGNSTPNSAASAPPTLQIGGRTFQKPPCSYSCLIVMALKNSETGCLPVSEIYSFMCDNFPFFQCAPPGWKNSVRHNLSMNDCFSKIEKDPLTMGPSASPPTQPLSVGSANVTLSNGGTGTAVAGGGLSIGNNGCGVRKGCLWAMNPGKVKKMDIELAKWSRKDPEGMRGAMKNPSDLDKLIKGELVVKTSSLKLEVKSEDEEDDCDNDDEDEEDALEKLVPTQIKRLSCERTREIVLEEDGFFPNEAEEQDDEAGESEDESSDSSSGDEEEEEEEIHMDLDYDSDSDEDRVPPSLKPFDLRHSSTTLDPLMTVENNNVSTTTTNKILASRPPTTTTTKILASRPLTTMTTTTATKSESAPKRPRLLSHQVKYVAVSKSPGLVTSALRQPMRLQ